VFAGKKSAQIREILISESAWEEMTCLFAPSLNDEGHRPLRSAGWNHTTVAKTINSVALYGAYQTSETTIDRKVILLDIIEDYYPAIISKEEFMLLQSDQKHSKPGYKSEHNAFSGILKHECGGALVRKFHVASGKTYQYHVCANARDGKCNVTKNFKNIEVALFRIMKELKIEERTNFDESLLAEENSLREKIQDLNDTILHLPKVPISVIQTISTLEEKLEQIESKIKQQNSMIISENAFDINLLQEVKEPQKLNMMLKRVIEQITVSNTGKKWWIKVLYRNRHIQSFIWDGEKITFCSDTKKTLDYINS